jgi:hypothetical protein
MMASAVYYLFARAMQERKQILCRYQGLPREICPIILGHTKDAEVALVFQFGGAASKGLPAAGEWKCLHLAKVSDVRLRDGPWHAGSNHDVRQSCVAVVDVDVNPESPYKPKRRLHRRG